MTILKSIIALEMPAAPPGKVAKELWLQGGTDDKQGSAKLREFLVLVNAMQRPGNKPVEIRAEAVAVFLELSLQHDIWFWHSDDVPRQESKGDRRIVLRRRNADRFAAASIVVAPKAGARAAAEAAHANSRIGHVVVDKDGEVRGVLTVRSLRTDPADVRLYEAASTARQPPPLSPSTAAAPTPLASPAAAPAAPPPPLSPALPSAPPPPQGGGAAAGTTSGSGPKDGAAATPLTVAIVTVPAAAAHAATATTVPVVNGNGAGPSSSPAGVSAEGKAASTVTSGPSNANPTPDSVTTTTTTGPGAAGGDGGESSSSGESLAQRTWQEGSADGVRWRMVRLAAANAQGEEQGMKWTMCESAAAEGGGDASANASIRIGEAVTVTPRPSSKGKGAKKPAVEGYVSAISWRHGLKRQPGPYVYAICAGVDGSRSSYGPVAARDVRASPAATADGKRLEAPSGELMATALAEAQTSEAKNALVRHRGSHKTPMTPQQRLQNELNTAAAYAHKGGDDASTQRRASRGPKPGGAGGSGPMAAGHGRDTASPNSVDDAIAASADDADGDDPAAAAATAAAANAGKAAGLGGKGSGRRVRKGGVAADSERKAAGAVSAAELKELKQALTAVKRAEGRITKLEAKAKAAKSTADKLKEQNAELRQELAAKRRRGDDDDTDGGSGGDGDGDGDGEGDDDDSDNGSGSEGKRPRGSGRGGSKQRKQPRRGTPSKSSSKRSKVAKLANAPVATASAGGGAPAKAAAAAPAMGTATAMSALLAAASPGAVPSDSVSDSNSSLAVKMTLMMLQNMLQRDMLQSLNLKHP